MKMKWETLLSGKRIGYEGEIANAIEQRSAFERDFDRIVFSSAFRRLQNKTQVFPLPETDFIHTRLTHSLETSSIGRSIGKIVGERILEFEKGNNFFEYSKVSASDFGAIVAAAALAHDIGNPPFGHSGEDAISDYFKSDMAMPYLESLSIKQKGDLQNFEGNALGFRKLTTTYPKQSDLLGGLQLSFATLGSFTKYPKESLPKSENKALASEKKYGFFQSEKEMFKTIANELGMIESGDEVNYKWKRHPLAFLMEAADDICYHIIDLEDGFNIGIISFEEVQNLLFYADLEDKSRYDKIHDKTEKVGYLRAKAIQKLINEVSEEFCKNYHSIMEGKYDNSLTNKIESAQKCKDIIKISREKIYNFKQVLEIEAAGFEVIGGLIDTFLNAALGKKTAKAQKLLSLIPNYYLVNETGLQNIKYEQIMNITDFVASMTDTAAITLFRKIKGISLPSL